MKAVYIVDGSEPAESLTLSEKRRTSISKLVKAMDRLCSICKTDFRSWVEQHELGVGEEIGGEVDFILPDSSYNARSDQKHDQVEYDMFRSNDVKDMLRVLEVVMKLGAYRQVLCPALQFALCYRVLDSEKRKVSGRYGRFQWERV